MATVTSLGNQFNTTSGNHTVTATPAIGDVIVVIAANTGNTNTSIQPTDNNSGGSSYTLATSALKATNADVMNVWVRNRNIDTAASTVWNHNPGTTSGGGIIVLKITGMTRDGKSGAVLQTAKQENQAAAGTPTPVFGSAANTNNPVIGAVFNATNPATMTPRASPAYTEVADVGYSVPTTGFEAMKINSGETATSIAWGGTSASAFCSIAIELDISAAPAPPDARKEYITVVPGSQNKSPVTFTVFPNLLPLTAPATPPDTTTILRNPLFINKREIRDIAPEFNYPNLLETTLGQGTPAQNPFIPELFDSIKWRPQTQVNAVQNLLSTLFTDTFIVTSYPESFPIQRPNSRLDNTQYPNLLLTTLFTQPAVPFKPVLFDTVKFNRQVSTQVSQAYALIRSLASITGSANINEQPDTTTASGTTTIVGTSSTTNSNDTSSASGTTTVTGTSSTTNNNDTVSASGSVGGTVTGTANITEQADTSSASGTTTITGASSTTNNNDTVTANGTTTIQGTLSKTNNNDTVSAFGFVGTPPSVTTYLPLTGVGH